MGNCKYGDPRRKVHQRVTWVAVSSSSVHTTRHTWNTEHRTLNTMDTSETSQHDTHKTQNTSDRLDTENTANMQNKLTEQIAHTHTLNNTKLCICTIQSSVQGHDHTLLQWYTCWRLMLTKGPNKNMSLNACAGLQL